MNDRKIECSGYLVDNVKDKNPLAGSYIEVVYHVNDGDYDQILTSAVTDANGYFELNGKYKVGFMNLDYGDKAIVYANADRKDILGEFDFQFPEGTYAYATLHLDTISLRHNIWAAPRIVNLGGFKADEIEINFTNCELTDPTQNGISFKMPIVELQTFEPIEIVMDMGLQHWVTYGTRRLANGTLKLNNRAIANGYLILEKRRPTAEGDTLHLNFSVRVD